MKIWILGGNGLLGASFKKLCQKRGIPNKATAREDVDITCKESVDSFANHFKPTHIVNCAAFTDVDGAESKADVAFDINAIGPENLGITAQKNHAKLIHISTNFIFSGQKDTPYIEEDLAQPINTYGMSKWEGEKRLLNIFPSACIIRTSWLFGKNGKNFISNLLQLMQKQEVLRVVDDQIGSPTFCEDLAEAVRSLLCHSGIFHFANGGGESRFQIAEKIFKKAKEKGFSLKCEAITPVPSSTFPTPAKRPPNGVLSTVKISGVLGKSPRHWMDVLEEYV